jgi:hypothetical protein
MTRLFLPSAVLALAFASPAVSLAQSPAAPQEASLDVPAKAAQAILSACIGSASSGAPVDTSGLMTYFEWDKKKRALLSLKPLPKLVLLINDNFAVRCSLLSGIDIASTDFGPAMAKAIQTWPRLQREDKPGELPSFNDPGDAAAGLHKVSVMNEVDGGTFYTRIWDAGLPKP